MDSPRVHRALVELREELDLLNETIRAFETLLSREQRKELEPRIAKQRGRKPGKMSAEERAAVSQRIKKYWADRRRRKDGEK